MTIVVVYCNIFSNAFINLKLFYSHLINKVILYSLKLLRTKSFNFVISEELTKVLSLKICLIHMCVDGNLSMKLLSPKLLNLANYEYFSSQNF